MTSTLPSPAAEPSTAASTALPPAAAYPRPAAPSSPRHAADHELQHRARRRVRMKLGWMTHAGVYLLVNAGLFAIQWLAGTPRWAHFPLLGWGIGLAIHGLVVLFALHGDGMQQRMVDAEVERLRRPR